MGKPEKKFRCGGCEAAIFVNDVTTKAGKDVQMKKVVLQKRYKDRNGEWASTNSFDVNDIPKARLALQEAYRYLVLNNGSEASGDENSQDE